MPIQLDHQEVTITSQRGFNVDGRRSRTFPSRVVNADAVICGFQLKYDNDADHHLAEVQVHAKWIRNVNDGADGPHVLFEVHTVLADRDANDPYSGFVNVLVIAETE